MANDDTFFEDTVGDWNWQRNDPYGYWMAKLNEQQKKLIDDTKREYNYHLDDYTTISYEEYQEKIEYHVSFEAKETILQREHFRILEKPSFNNSYRNILNKENNMIVDEVFPKFIMGFKVVGLASNEINEANSMEALMLLEDIAALNVLEIMIATLDYEKGKIMFNDKIYNSVKGQRFFKYVFDKWLKNEDTFNAVHCVLRLLWEKQDYVKDNDLAIKGNAKNIMEYWNRVYAPHCKNKNAVFNIDVEKPKINEASKIGANRMDEWKTKLNKLIEEFNEK
ncbi:MAG: hypothetical protein KDC90_07425 [Ignavibacteriae bacterium]|nr:hypothetical protein [Ignavibacteriota bacterium]